jgi:hypothetical protein
LDGVIAESEKLIAILEKIDFRVSHSSATSGSHSGLTALLKDLKKEADKTRKVNTAEQERFEEVIRVLEDMVFAEALTKRIYLLSSERFNLEALLDKPQLMFSSSVFQRLPAIARQDLSGAFQCLAFDQPTATAFHVLRATEAVIKAYYLVVVKRGRLETPMWGNMLDALAKRRDSDETLLGRLRYIKDSFRNPTSHPEATHTLSEAQDLIGICVDVINRMAGKLPISSDPRK